MSKPDPAPTTTPNDRALDIVNGTRRGARLLDLRADLRGQAGVSDRLLLDVALCTLDRLSPDAFAIVRAALEALHLDAPTAPEVPPSC